jgi:hypothetical protein
MVYLGHMEPRRAPHITVRRATLGPEDERLDREFWAGIPPEERVEEAWRLTLELWELKGWDAGEPGLRRPAARVVRR